MYQFILKPDIKHFFMYGIFVVYNNFAHVSVEYKKYFDVRFPSNNNLVF